MQIRGGLNHLLYKYLAVYTKPFVAIYLYKCRVIPSMPPATPMSVFVGRCRLCATTLFRTRVDTAPACSNRGDI
nr:MAG TPA: hypothetical protein [Caudoviricetes sp.]